MLFRNVRARNTHVEATLNHSVPAQAHCAALFDSPAALTFLHKVGCDLEARCAYAETPMIKAARAQALRALKYLRDNGSKHAETEHRNVEGDNARALVVDNMRHWRLGVEGEL
jgi:hypothetical protein